MKEKPVANVRMYSATASLRSDWRSLLQWVLADAGISWTVIDYDAPAPLNELWRRPDLGMVMMCGLPFAKRTSSASEQLPMPRAIAAPLPSPPRYDGRPVYFTDLVVRTDSPFRTLEDTFGGVLGYTLTDSMSGGVAVRQFMTEIRANRRERLYSRTVGDLLNGRGVIDALMRGVIDVGPLDSYFHDLLGKNDPVYAGQIRTVATTRAWPIPLLVATSDLSPNTLESLRGSLRKACRAAELHEVCQRLLLSDFVVPTVADYVSLKDLTDREMYALEDI